jgi:hypothetical protein
LSSPEVGVKYSLFLSSISEGGGERDLCAVLNCAMRVWWVVAAAL